MQRCKALVLVLTASALLVGCTSGPGSSSGSASLSSGQVSGGLTPPGTQSVATVTWALPGGEPATLDPLGTVDNSPNTVISNMCESLLRTQPDLSTTPGLASSITQPNPTTFVIDLRDGVKFWDGSPLTAEDVAYSLKRFADPANGSGWITTYLNIDTIEVTGPMQVTVTLKIPDVLFRATLGTGGAFISQAKFVESAGKEYGSPSKGVMCTGPFKFTSWTSGDSIVMEKNPSYWDSTLQPKVDKLVFRFIDDAATLLSALTSGDVDGAYDISPQIYEQLAASGVGAGYNTPGLQNLQLFGVAQADNPLNDVRIRQAWRLALDYEGITDGILRGTAEPARAVVGPATWGYSVPIYQAAYDALPKPTTDLDKAKQLVAEAGVPSRPVVVTVVAGSQNEQVALAVQAAGESVGIPVKVNKLTSTQYAALFTDSAGLKGTDAIVVTGFSDFAEPAQYYSYFRKGQYYNFFNYDNPKFDSLVDKALSTYDDDARAALVAEAQAIFMTDLPSIPIAFPNVILFMNSRISGAPASWAYMSSPWAAYLGGT